MNNTSVEPRPIGGWLFLLGFGVILNPFVVLFSVYTAYAPVFQQNLIPILLDSTDDAYQPMLAILIIAEVTVNLGLVVGWIFAAFAFLTRKLVFPRVYIGLIVFNVFFLIGDALVIGALFDLEAEGGAFDEDTVRAIVRSAITACIWVPYLLISVRVKETFMFQLNGKIAGSESLQDVFD